MQICKVKNYQELSRKAANLIAAQINPETGQYSWPCYRFISCWNL